MQPKTHVPFPKWTETRSEIKPETDKFRAKSNPFKQKCKIQATETKHSRLKLKLTLNGLAALCLSLEHSMQAWH
jgi:hypothetical protein